MERIDNSMFKTISQEEHITIDTFLKEVTNLLDKIDCVNFPEFKFEHILADGGMIKIKRKLY